MNSLFIDAQNNKNPRIHFDATSGILNISGVSRSENSSFFYSPILTWITFYTEQPAPETVLNFNVKYFNTRAAKCILEILEALVRTHEENRTKLMINWHYMTGDEDMQETGENYSEILEIDFNFIEN